VFEGILPNMERRYRETDSPPCARSWRATAACSPAPTCDGTRLRSEARHVRLGDDGQSRTIYEIGHMTLRECLAYFEHLHLPAPRPRSPTRWCARSATA
jgi:excinuclease ABC subunit A